MRRSRNCRPRLSGPVGADHAELGTSRARARRRSRAKSATSASRTAAGCASRSRSRTPTSSGCPTSGFQTVYRLFNADERVVCERVFLPAEAGAAPRSSRAARAARHDRVADAGPRFRRLRVLRLLRMGLHQRRDDAAAGGAASRAPSARHARDPLVVIGGAVTFVNPEPLAPFADVIAAGEGELLVPVARRGVRATPRDRERAARAARGRARLLRPESVRRDATTARARRGHHAEAGHRRAAGRAEGRGQGADRLDPPARGSSRPTPSSDRGC